MESKNKIWNQLDELKKKESFRVPKSYFDTFSTRVQERIATENEPEKIPGLWVILKPSLSLAAFLGIFALLIKFGLLLMPDKINTKDDVMAESDELIYNQYHLIDWYEFENMAQADSTYETEVDEFIIAYAGDIDFIEE